MIVFINLLFLLFSHFIELKTNSELAIPPDAPQFALDRIHTDDENAKIKLLWKPNLHGKPGSHFYGKYRVKGSTDWIDTPKEMGEDFIIVSGLKPERQYEFAAVSVNGEYETMSSIQEVDTSGIGKLVAMWYQACT